MSTSNLNWALDDDFGEQLMHSAQSESSILGNMDVLVSSQGQTPAMMMLPSPQQQQQPAAVVVPQQQRHLIVVSQECLAKQEYHSSKQHELLHVLVKNTPFNVALRLVDMNAGNCVALNDVNIEVTLLYSHNDEAVPHPNGDAVTFEVPESSADSLVLRTRIHALSSKHEKMNFRMRIVLCDRQSGHALGEAYTALSGAIKCVSKPDQALRCAAPTESTRGASARRRTAAIAAGTDDESSDDDAKRNTRNKRARTVATPGTAFLSGVGAAAAINALMQMSEKQQDAITKLNDKVDVLLRALLQVKTEC